jgi:hypothetical protein
MSFKTFDLAHDVASLVSSINEVVSISSSLFITGSGDLNIKKFDNIASSSLQASNGIQLGGYWETAYDSSPTSIASTALFDMTYGYSTSSFARALGVGADYACIDEKTKVYREMASMLLGSPDAQFTISGSSQSQCFFIMVKRGLMKDELKKGSIDLRMSASVGYVTATDVGAATSFKQTIGGDYAPLYSAAAGNPEVGQVWYNAGVIVVPAGSGTAVSTGLPWNGNSNWSGSYSVDQAQTSGSINMVVDGFRAHVDKINFHNQTNLYSTVYFCRATNTEFNYSSNPTYVDSAQRIRVTSGSNVLQSRTYVTTIGLYDANDNLLAVGKLNKPITKAPDTESIFRIRLDY